MLDPLDPLSAIVHLRNHPCDASCKKMPPDASQIFAPPPQPIEKEALKTSRIKIPHTRPRCVTRLAWLADP
jgi:hypothetical protein